MSILPYYENDITNNYFIAAASSATSSGASAIINRSRDLVNSGDPISVTEHSLIKKEADLRSEIDITVNRLHFLLQYFDILKDQHIKVLKDLHVAEGSTTAADDAADTA